MRRNKSGGEGKSKKLLCLKQYIKKKGEDICPISRTWKINDPILCCY